MTDMRAICETLGFDPTNHHNAAKCPYCRPASSARLEGEANIVDGELVIRLRIETLAHAARHSDYFFNCAEQGMPLKITDEAAFAKSVARALNREEEDGSTPITRTLDKAFEWISEQGEDGVEDA